MKRYRILLTGLVLAAAVCGSAFADITDNGRFTKVRALIVDLIKDSNVPSISVAVAQRGKIIWEESFGWANREKMIKATPHTMYSIASTSKPFTATGLMILVERKLVDLSQSVNTYLGQSKLTAIEAGWPPPTVKHVMNHTAGLPLHYQFFYENEPYRRPSMDETIRRYGFLVRAPGEFYLYSNLGYGIIDFIISRVSGRSYADFMRTEVFLPLGLIHTTVGIGPGLEEFAAQRYDGEQEPIPFYTFDHDGASAVYSSAHDLIRFGMFHLKNHLPEQKAILKDETIDLMQDGMESTTPLKDYGLGWAIHENDCGYKTIVHGGGMPGVSTDLKLLPTENIAVVVLGNTRDRLIYTVKDEIIGTLLPKYGDNYRAKQKAQAATANVPPRFAPPKSLIGEWSGEIHTYNGIMPVNLTVREDGTIHIRIKDQLETLLNSPDLKGDILTGIAAGSIKTDDAARSAHVLQFGMRVQDDRMSGLVSALADKYFALSSWILLNKAKANPPS